VRRDLPKTYQAVQAIHVTAQYMLDHKDLKGWNNGVVVLLGVKDETELKEWIDRLIDKDKDFSTFMEDDLDFQLTTIACVDSGEIFSDLRLL